MCCFAQPVVSVTDTNIFARMLPHGWQYLVYQMNFKSNEKNAMVLPLPVDLSDDKEGAVEFLSLQHHGRFFEDLNDGFPLARYPGVQVDSRVMSNHMTTLRVHQVGDFIASFVPTANDFDRLDPRFRIPRESWDQIPHYSDYGFAVFQLETREGKPHPMAFKFRSRLNQSAGGSLFFPTVHIHDGEVHKRENFDHTLFLQAPAFDNACSNYKQRGYLVTDPATGYVRSKWPAGQFCDIKASQGIIDPDGLVHRLEMRGRFKNSDVLASIDPSDLGRSSGILPWLGLSAVAGMAGIVGLKWLFDRRDLVSSQQIQETNG